VRVRLCPIGICVAHSFAACPRSAYFYRNLQAWSKITNQLYVWHYNTNFTHYLLPFPDFDELAADIPMYRKHGVKGLFMQGAYPPGGGGEMAWLRSWVMAKLLWDPSQDAQKLVDEFLEGVYGRAAGPMRRYFDLLHGEVRPAPAGRGLHLWIFNVPDYSPRLLEEGFRLFDQAEKAAENDAVRQRIRKDRLSLEYLALLRGLRYEVRGRRYGPADLPRLQKEAREFLARVREHGIQSLHEGRGLDFDENYFGKLREYEVISLENRQWRADIVPDLGGRIVRFFDKVRGRELLRRPPFALRYPDTGGIIATIHGDRHSSAWPVRWHAERSGPDQVLLTATLENGLQARHRILLSAKGLALETRLLNPTAERLDAAIQHRAEADPSDIDAETLVYEAAGPVRRKLIEPDQEPAGRLTLDADGLPRAGWWLEPAGFFASFEEAARAALQWTARTPPGVVYLHWTAEQRLAPGGALRLESFYSRR